MLITSATLVSTSLILKALQQTQPVAVTGPISLVGRCYNLTSVFGSVTRRLNGRDVPVGSVKVRISVGNVVLGEGLTNAVGSYRADCNLGNKLWGNANYIFDASVVTKGFSGRTSGKLRVNKEVTGIGYVLQARPFAGKFVGVLVSFYSTYPAQQRDNWITTNIGYGRTDANGKLLLHFRPVKGVNRFEVNYGGTNYQMPFKGVYTIVGI